MKLTETKCKNAKPFAPPKKAPKKYTDGDGLSLWVMSNGAKYWRLAYRFYGKQKDYAIGVYPEVTLNEAREKRREARKLLAQNIDTNVNRKKQQVIAEERNANTFEALAREWYENNQSKWEPRYAEGVLNRLEKDIFPEIGSIPIREIEPQMLLQTIRKIEKRNALEIARRQLQKCGEIFRYAIACGKADRDPSNDIKGALKPIKRGNYAAIDVKELPDFLRALEKNDARLYRSTRNAIKLIMLTFVRTSELINAEWKEIDFDAKLWTIPAARMKMRKEHLVPLSKQALAILADQKEISSPRPLVFPSNVRPKQSISNNTILSGISSLGFKGRMTGHGFRALAMSAIKQELGYRHEVVDRQLAHVPKGKVDKAYDRALFLNDRVVMMQDWADYIDKLGTDEPN